jgi:hypothetical protein
MADKKTSAASPKAAKKTAKSGDAGATAAPSARGACSVEACKQPLRAKGYCRKHFLAWRREKLGAHHHYKICTKEGCRKPREHGSLCAEHAGKGAPAEAAPAA